MSLARSQDLLLAVRCGGHYVTKLGLRRRCRDRPFDPELCIARAEASLTPAASIAPRRHTSCHQPWGVGGTGIVVLKLGGGFGRLGRKHARDDLFAADTVIADPGGAPMRTPISSGRYAAASAGCLLVLQQIGSAIAAAP